MEEEVQKPPDGGGGVPHPTGWAKPRVGGRSDGGEEEGVGPGLPSPLAAAVSASQHEGREAQSTGAHLQGEGLVRTETAAAARFMQAQGAEGPGALGGLPLDSLVSVVMTDPEGSKGENASLGGDQSGEGTGEVGTGTAGRVPPGLGHPLD